MKLSNFGNKFTQDAGINSLMVDLGEAMKDENSLMMGGGNPGYLPEVQQMFQRELQNLAGDDQAFRNLTGIYDPPQGDKAFREALAELLAAEYQWPIAADHIALTNGSQSAFFMLFNMFAGKFTDGSYKRVMLPMVPEYIGYADAGLAEDFFISRQPLIEMTGDHRFKYHVDFEQLNIDDSIGLLCVSRPTNPTGNVLTDEEMARLVAIAAEKDIPLVVDGAYGLPFPNLVFTDAQPVWDEHLILCLSLSKLGLPAVRTGIVIAAPEIITALSTINAILNLAPSSFGPVLACSAVRNRQILQLSEKVVKPFYQQKAQKAVEILDRELTGIPYALHEPEGAMFLWLWLRDCPAGSDLLYRRLKEIGVILVSGHYFFPGLPDDWEHARQCLRITYSQDDRDVEKGLLLLAKEIHAIYGC